MALRLSRLSVYARCLVGSHAGLLPMQSLRLLPSSQNRTFANTTSQKPVMVSYDKIFLDSLQSLGFDKLRSENAILKSPEILKATLGEMESIINLFLQYGYDHGRILKMIILYPGLLKLHKDDIESMMELFKKCHVGERFLMSFFGRSPRIFTLDEDKIYQRFAHMSHILGNKLNRVQNLLMICPEVLYIKWEDLQSRLEYVLITMGCTEKELSRSRALAHTIDHLKIRHTFVEKSGVFIKRKPDERPGFSQHMNPLLARIVDTHDDEFAANVAGVSPDEYEVYTRLMKYDEDYDPISSDDESDILYSDDEDDY